MFSFFYIFDVYFNCNFDFLYRWWQIIKRSAVLITKKSRCGRVMMNEWLIMNYLKYIDCFYNECCTCCTGNITESTLHNRQLHRNFPRGVVSDAYKWRRYFCDGVCPLLFPMIVKKVELFMTNRLSPVGIGRQNVLPSTISLICIRGTKKYEVTCFQIVFR